MTQFIFLIYLAVSIRCHGSNNSCRYDCIIRIECCSKHFVTWCKATWFLKPIPTRSMPTFSIGTQWIHVIIVSLDIFKRRILFFLNILKKNSIWAIYSMTKGRQCILSVIKWTKTLLVYIPIGFVAIRTYGLWIFILYPKTIYIWTIGISLFRRYRRYRITVIQQ